MLNAVVFDGKIEGAEYQRVFAAYEQNRPDAVIVAYYTVHLTHTVGIVELAANIAFQQGVRGESLLSTAG